jgi:hypothetical protein
MRGSQRTIQPVGNDDDFGPAPIAAAQYGANANWPNRHADSNPDNDRSPPNNTLAPPAGRYQQPRTAQRDGFADLNSGTKLKLDEPVSDGFATDNGPSSYRTDDSKYDAPQRTYVPPMGFDQQPQSPAIAAPSTRSPPATGFGNQRIVGGQRERATPPANNYGLDRRPPAETLRAPDPVVVPPPTYGTNNVLDNVASSAANSVEQGARNVSTAIRNGADAIANERIRRGNSYFLTLLALFGSIGLNMYLGWIAWDTYSRYQDLVTDLRYTGSRRGSDADSGYDEPALAEASY